jgi:hypothetical protein
MLMLVLLNGEAKPRGQVGQFNFEAVGFAAFSPPVKRKITSVALLLKM